MGVLDAGLETFEMGTEIGECGYDLLLGWGFGFSWFFFFFLLWRRVLTNRLEVSE